MILDSKGLFGWKPREVAWKKMLPGKLVIFA
jgi:hypothetical protein